MGGRSSQGFKNPSPSYFKQGVLEGWKNCKYTCGSSTSEGISWAQAVIQPKPPRRQRGQ